jgi:hypothetical protein
MTQQHVFFQGDVPKLAELRKYDFLNIAKTNIPFVGLRDQKVENTGKHR